MSSACWGGMWKLSTVPSKKPRSLRLSPDPGTTAVMRAWTRVPGRREVMEETLLSLRRRKEGGLAGEGDRNRIEGRTEEVVSLVAETVKVQVRLFSAILRTQQSMSCPTWRCRPVREERVSKDRHDEKRQLD